MFLNISTGGDLRRIVVRLCAYLLIVGLVGQALIVGPLPRAKANISQLPAPVSAPPEPFEVSSAGSLLSFLPETSGVIASLFAFAAPKSKETSNKQAGFENAVLEPLDKTVDSGKLRVDSKAPSDSLDSQLSTINSPLSTIRSPPPPPAGEVKYDFDGDGKADIGRWRGVATEFKTKNSNGGAFSTYTLGSTGAVAAPGDFNGDGVTDAAVFSAGTWTYKTSPSATAQTISWGTSGDVPFVGKFDSDSIADVVIFRPSTNTWWIRQSTNGAAVMYQWGATGDIPITGNWDGDTTTDIAVYRSGTWYIQKSSGGSIILPWGLSYDIPVQGDFDGDGKSDITVFRPTTGTWYVLKSSSNWATYSMTNWGVWSDQPTPADYDGDDITDLSVWRPTDGTWYTIKSSDNTYQIQTLGISGDTAVPSAYTKQVGGTASGDVINAERVKPRNATGGTNLYSQNFSWGTSLVGLPGRAGLDAGFGIGYNSLVWLKVGNAMYFDPDHGNMTPGFRMGFPVIEPAYYNATRQKWAYMMVTPSGSRVEFIETAASNTYETADSSYTQLTVTGATNPFDPVENLSIKVTTTDGTQMTYAWVINSYKCTQIKDRNGNYITLQYDWAGRLATMTDTLGRVVTVNYDPNNGLPSTITQTWKDNNGQGSNVTHTWATFAYTTKAVDTDFATTLSIIGPPDGTVLTVLDKITYPDGSSTKFEYNDYLQVKKVSSVAADSPTHVLNYVTTNLESPTSATTNNWADCPRFTETRTKVENFNNGSEIIINNTIATSQPYTLPHTSGTATRIQVWMNGHPDNLRSNTFVYGSGWNEGLPVATEDCLTTSADCTDRKRWTWTNWTQDDVTKTYIVNPRVTESKVGDTTNTKRSTVEYRLLPNTTIAEYGLVSAVNVYDTDQTTVLKRSETDYNLAAAYTSRRIIGLPLESRSYGRENGLLPLVSKMTYAFDGGDFSDATLNQNISPVQHDNTNYGASFITGRGLLTSMTRCDAILSSTTCGGGITSSVKYNTAGSLVAQITPWDGTNTRTVRIGYADNFNTTGNPATYAYPTVLTDPAGTALGEASHSSTVKYRYDIGANIEAVSPPPTGQTYGKTSKRIFDEVGRLKRNSIYVNTTEKSYVRYEFPTNGIQSQSYTPIVDVDGDGDIAEDEVYSESWFDGAGRVRKSRTEHPNSTSNWAATQTEYDILGRVTRTSVPTEISVPNVNDPNTWTAAGDDAARGFIWNYAYYDWKGRTIRTVPSDSNGSDGKDTLITYEGCGCAGGQIVTIKGPITTAVDVAGQTQTTKRRTQKAYEDILGRTFKTETWDLDGGGILPYSTQKVTFNGRDQTIVVGEFAGSDTNYTSTQQSTMTYDGHGRLKTKHIPQQDANTVTNYNYNIDDSISNVTDARGAVTNYTYNSLGLVTNIGWTVPSGSNITDPADVTFAYNNLGRRTTMTDALGSVAYSYNELSQMTDETRTFTDTIPNAPISQHGFKLEYTYALSGQLKSLKDPYGQQTNYAFDKAGRLNSVTDAGSFAGISVYANNPGYRAWGGLKSLTFGNGVAQTTTFNNRLQPATFELHKADNTQIMQKSYEYNNDASFKSLTDSMDHRFDRVDKYDFAARMSEGLTGADARGETIPSGSRYYEIPYKQNFSYDALGNITSRQNEQWGTLYPTTYTYSNTRITNTGWTYDADGRVLTSPYPDGPTTSTYDAAGNMRTSVTSEESNLTHAYDGTGLEVKRTAQRWKASTSTWINDTRRAYTYFVRSSVLGGRVVTEANPGRTKTFVHAAGAKIATQLRTSSNALYFEHTDADGTSMRNTSASGYELVAWRNGEFSPVELAMDGSNVGKENPDVENPPEIPEPIAHNFNEDMVVVNGRLQPCEVIIDGFSEKCSTAKFLARAGGLVVRLYNDHGQFIERDVEEMLGHLRFPSSVTRHATYYPKEDWLVVNDTTNSWTIDISWAPQQQTKVPFNIPKITEGIKKVWDDPPCRDIIQRLLNGVATKKNPLVEGGDLTKLLALLLKQKGFTRDAPKGSAGYGSPIGLFKDKDAGIFSLGVRSKTAAEQLRYDIETAVDELMHLAGKNKRFTDRNFADFVKDNPDLAKMNAPGIAPPYDQPQPYPLDRPNLTKRDRQIYENNTGHEAWSGYWHMIVYNVCTKREKPPF